MTITTKQELIDYVKAFNNTTVTNLWDGHDALEFNCSTMVQRKIEADGLVKILFVWDFGSSKPEPAMRVAIKK